MTDTPMFTREMVDRSRWAKPDLGYRRSVVRIRAACHAAALAALIVALYAFAVDLPVAGVLAAFLTFAALRMGDEARQEIERWRHGLSPVPPPPRVISSMVDGWTYDAEIGWMPDGACLYRLDEAGQLREVRRWP